MSNFISEWREFLLTESYKEEFTLDTNLKCKNRFDEYKLDYDNIKSVLTEAEEVLLIEGRKSDFKKKYLKDIYKLYMSDPSWAEEEHMAQTNTDLIVGFFINEQPENSQNKYLMDMGRILVSQYKLEGDNDANKILEIAKEVQAAVAEYDRNKSGMKQRTLSGYKNLDSLKKALFDDLKLPRIMTARAQRKEDEESGRLPDVFDQSSHEIVYEDERFFVVRPFTRASSCYFGQKTNWCITKIGNKYFGDYTENEGKIFYFIRDDSRNVNHSYARVAIQYIGDEDEQEFEGYWNRDNDWLDPDDLYDESEWPEKTIDDILEAIEKHAALYPPTTHGLKKLVPRIEDESEFDVVYDNGSKLFFSAWLEDYDVDSIYSSLQATLKLLIKIPEYIIDNDHGDEFHEFLEENLEEIFESSEIDNELDYYSPILYARETGNDIYDAIQIKEGPEPDILELTMELHISENYYTDADTMEREIDNIRYHFDDGVIEDLTAAIVKTVSEQMPHIRTEGYKKVLGYIRAIEEGEKLFNNVQVSYETDRIESFDEEDANDVILDFTYKVDFLMPFNVVGQAAFSDDQRKARQDFNNDIVYSLKREMNAHVLLKVFRGIIEKLQEAAYKAAIKQVKIDFPDFEYDDPKEVISSPHFHTPEVYFENDGLRLTFKSEFEVNADDLEEVDISYNYFKYIDDNYDEVSKFLLDGFVSFLRKIDLFAHKRTSRYFDPNVNEHKFTKNEILYLREFIKRSR